MSTGQSHVSNQSWTCIDLSYSFDRGTAESRIEAQCDLGLANFCRPTWNIDLDIIVSSSMRQWSLNSVPLAFHKTSADIPDSMVPVAGRILCL